MHRSRAGVRVHSLGLHWIIKNKSCRERVKLHRKVAAFIHSNWVTSYMGPGPVSYFALRFNN